jgi:hypothetical protein
MKIAAVFLFPAIGLLILILGPAIRNKILKHEHKERGINPSDTLTTYASKDILYRTVIQANREEKEREQS